MKTKYKYFEFIKKGNVWVCQTIKGSAKLGFVAWHTRWSTYVFDPDPATFSPDCLRDIAEFMENLNKERGK